MNTLPNVFPMLAERLGWALLHSLWQGLLVAALLAIVLRALRHSSAAARHAACIVALAVLLAGIVVTGYKIETAATGGARLTKAAPVTSTKNALRESAPQSDLRGTDLESPAVAVDASPAGSSSVDAPAPTLLAARPWRAQIAPLLPWLAAGWISGVVLLSLRHAGGCLRVRALRRRGVSSVPETAAHLFSRLKERLAVRQAVRLLASARAATPMLVGVFKPVVLLPAGMIAGLRPCELEAILAHELAHLARGDAWANLFQVVVETVLFYHPAVWWIGHRARTEREHAADDLAVRLCADRLTYAGALARLAELTSVPPLALAAAGGSLLARIRRIAAPPAQPEPAGGWAFGAIALAATTLLLPFAHTTAADAPIHVVPGQSIQSAIDAAPNGAVVHLDAGEWKEHIVISKPLTLEGEGWQKSRIEIEEPQMDEIKGADSEVELQRKAAVTPEEKRAAETEYIRRLAKPGVWVRNTEGVVVRQLRLQGSSQRGSKDGGTSSTLLYIQRSKATMTDAAVVGPFGSGIQITPACEVEIRKSLVAAIWSNGIVVSGRGRDGTETPGRLHLVDCEIRSIYHYGIALGPGCDTSLIERCRISGTAWHGIRYDDASPTITGNTIFAHARSGIYASGKTHATVRGNLFWKNEMDGISCWEDNTDIIEENTFAGNLREGLGVIGAKPTINRNIFFDNPVAIIASSVGRRDGTAGPVGEPKLMGNLFWQNKTVMTAGKEGDKPAPEGSLSADPKFVDAAKQNFALVADSPAKQANVGVAEPLSVAGPWPLLAEEKSIIPAEDTHEYRFWTAPGEAKATKSAEDRSIKARTDAKDILDDAFQLDDAAKRTAAVERIRTALGSGDTSAVRMGLAAFIQVQKVEFDKPSFRPALRKLLKSGEGDLRAQAIQGLATIGPDNEDLESAIAMHDDASADVRNALPNAIKSLSPEGFTGKAGEAVLKLLDRNDGKATQAVWHAMWGTKISPELEKRVVEASRKDDHGSGYSEVFYYALTVHQSKREPTITRLIELLASQDMGNVAGRALWGLRQGVEKDQRPRVAEAALKVIAARSDDGMRQEALSCLRDYGTTAHAAPLKELLAKPGVTGDFKKALEETLTQIEKRPADHS